LNRVDAKNEIFGAVASNWAAVLAPIVGTNNELRYFGLKYSSEVPVTKYWGRLSIQTVSEDQETLRNEVRRYRSYGLVFVQLFAPINDSQAATKLDQIADALRNLFRHCTAADNVQFSRARIADNIDPEAAWLRANVVAEFEYNQFV
jgi:hypothetical protein